MSSLTRELVFLILQFMNEEKFKESIHKLEQESGFYFNLKYFEEKVLAGEWDEVERYLSGFTKVDDNGYSIKIFFLLRKQKYLEALDKNHKAKALEILVKDLKIFSTHNEETYKEITQLLTLENFRENEQLSKYGDTRSARTIMLVELKKLIEANPLFREKLNYPILKASILRTLINQSVNWQHQLCKNPRSNPSGASMYTQLGHHRAFPPAAANPNALGGWMVSTAASSVQPAVASAPPIPVTQNHASLLKHPRTPSNVLNMSNYQSMKLLRPAAHVDEVTPFLKKQVGGSPDDLPRTVVCTLHQGSKVTSMDFHPYHHKLLAVGSLNGEITLWDVVGLQDRLVSKPFKIHDVNTCSSQLQAIILKDSSVSINRVTWSPDGNVIGVAFSKHLIHVHVYQVPNVLRHLIEVDAHVGGVNDIAFAHPNNQPCVVTCGDDKLIKVWDLNGQKLHQFEGHEAPVYSICPAQKGNVHYIFSTSVDGKIKVWLYDAAGSQGDYDAPGRWCTTMLYNADGSRLFACGTSKDGEPYLVEWNEIEGAIKRTYLGFHKKSAGVVKFDMAKNHILAAGEDSQIKFWDVDNLNMIASTDADGGLLDIPQLKFNKAGNLLAATTADNSFKILTNSDGLRALGTSGTIFEAFNTQNKASSVKAIGSAGPVISGILPNISKAELVSSNYPAIPSPIMKGFEIPSIYIRSKPRVKEDISDRPKPREFSEIINPQHCCVIAMPDNTDPASKVARLLYTNSGAGLLALASNSVQRLWKWTRSDQNPTGKATASVVPVHWQPNSGLAMTNDVEGVKLEDAVPCIALSKNDSYVMSACGGKISLFNMMTFKVMTAFMPPPPSPTFIAFLPQDNNIIAIGMEDSTILIYNVKVDKVKMKLKGHQKRITGLAFSNSLNILVSSGADTQLIVWATDPWKKNKSTFIQLPKGKDPAGDTRVQFNTTEQTRLLVTHETQIAIYDASNMELLHQWIPHDTPSAPISYASYSCNSQLVYVSFCDGNICVFEADNLRLRCRIAPSAYLAPTAVNSNPPVYPLVLAVHPQEPNQVAVGLTNGDVKVIEPLESQGKWGASPVTADPIKNAAALSGTSNPTSGQL